MDVYLKNISKAFRDITAVDNVSLDIHSGELIGLLGPSGSGKTTLLRLIAGLEFPCQGAVFFANQDASRLTVKERNVGFVFQNYALFKHMTVADNVGFGLKVRKRSVRLSRKAIQNRVGQLLELVQLAGFQARYPHQLSGGQRQRVALARALAIEPRILLLDEPFGALDAQVRRELRQWLREMHETTGHTTIFVTHDQEEALELSDRIVVMDGGKIEQVGSADQIYDTPINSFVYSFIGESNTLPACVTDHNIVCLGQNTGLRAEYQDGDGQLYFRPHGVKIVEDQSNALFGRLVAQRRFAGVRRVTLAIDETDYFVEIDVPIEMSLKNDEIIKFQPRYWQFFS